MQDWLSGARAKVVVTEAIKTTMPNKYGADITTVCSRRKKQRHGIVIVVCSSWLRVHRRQRSESGTKIWCDIQMADVAVVRHCT